MAWTIILETQTLCIHNKFRTITIDQLVNSLDFLLGFWNIFMYAAFKYWVKQKLSIKFYICGHYTFLCIHFIIFCVTGLFINISHFIHIHVCQVYNKITLHLTNSAQILDCDALFRFCSGSFWLGYEFWRCLIWACFPSLLVCFCWRLAFLVFCVRWYLLICRH